MNNPGTHRLAAALSVGAIAGLIVISTAGPAASAVREVAPTTVGPAAAPEVPVIGPQLSITIDNGRSSVTAGDTVDYVLTVQNLGTADVDGLLINQSVPTGLTFGSADSGGVSGSTGVDWTLDLKATETATFKTTMTVGATAPELLRLASVACARVSADGPPIVCAAHSDQLPAGAVAEANQAATETAPASESGGWPWWYLAAGLALVLAIAAVMTLLILRRKRWRRIPTPAAPEVMSVRY